METKKRPRVKRIKKEEGSLEKKIEKLASHHRAEIRDGVVIIVPEQGELDLSDPRNELVGSINEEDLQISKTQGIVTLRKSYDTEIQYVVDDQTQLLAQKQAEEARLLNEQNLNEARKELKPENLNGAVVVESESYKDIIEVLNYQDSGKLTR